MEKATVIFTTAFDATLARRTLLTEVIFNQLGEHTRTSKNIKPAESVLWDVLNMVLFEILNLIKI